MQPAFRFDVDPPGCASAVAPERGCDSIDGRRRRAPASIHKLALASTADLGELIHSRRVSSLELDHNVSESHQESTDPQLLCVITVCEELALKQAKRADAEIARGCTAGRSMAFRGGRRICSPSRSTGRRGEPRRPKDQVIDFDATVVERLEAAGAVLLAKLSLGETARGTDGSVWFGGMTRNPWNLDEGASGSSAGPASATSAGLCGFAVGSDTRGSIILPCNRCGASGLRPTFGTVSRHGAMVLAWTMDRLGPICRTVEDCAIVFDAIRGADSRDLSARDVPFGWDADRSLDGLRVGYAKAEFERSYAGRAADEAALAVLRKIGLDLVPVELPAFPHEALRLIMDAETGASFDQLTRSNQDDLLAAQDKSARPNNLRHSRLIPAVESSPGAAGPARC